MPTPHRQHFLPSFFLGFSLMTALGCSDGSSGGGPATLPWNVGGQAGFENAAGSTSTGGSLQSDGDGGTSAAGSGGSSPAVASGPQCEAYIACTAETSPAGLGVVLAAYGADGNCWKQGSPSLCEDACAKGIKDALQAFPKAEACNQCATSADCPSSLPACDPSSQRCVRCLSDSECKGTDNPACDPATHTCVACTSDLHCPDKLEGKGFCDTGTNTCVGCQNSSHCSGTFFICDATSKSCRWCQENSECPAGLCFLGSCTCNQQGDCPAGLSCQQAQDSFLKVCK